MAWNIIPNDLKYYLQKQCLNVLWKYGLIVYKRISLVKDKSDLDNNWI